MKHIRFTLSEKSVNGFLPFTMLSLKLLKLEQLRYLEYGKRIKMVETSHGSIGIDTPEDLERARKLL